MPEGPQQITQLRRKEPERLEKAGGQTVWEMYNGRVGWENTWRGNYPDMHEAMVNAEGRYNDIDHALARAALLSVARVKAALNSMSEKELRDGGVMLYYSHPSRISITQPNYDGRELSADGTVRQNWSGMADDMIAKLSGIAKDAQQEALDLTNEERQVRKDMGMGHVLISTAGNTIKDFLTEPLPGSEMIDNTTSAVVGAIESGVQTAQSRVEEALKKFIRIVGFETSRGSDSGSKQSPRAQTAERYAGR